MLTEKTKQIWQKPQNTTASHKRTNACRRDPIKNDLKIKKRKILKKRQQKNPRVCNQFHRKWETGSKGLKVNQDFIRFSGYAHFKNAE